MIKKCGEKYQIFAQIIAQYCCYVLLWVSRSVYLFVVLIVHRGFNPICFQSVCK